MNRILQSSFWSVSGIFLMLLASIGEAQTSSPSQALQGRILQEGTSAPIAGVQVTLSIPSFTVASDEVMQLAASLGAPPGAFDEIRQMIAEFMQASPAELQSEIDEARKDGVPPEYIAILTRLRTAKIGSPGFPKHTITDSSGHFEFPDVPAGNYVLTAERDGFLGFSAKGTNARSKTASVPVTVGDRQAASAVTVLMTPGALIQGRLRDSNGMPLPNFSVWALTQAYQDGEPILQSSAKQVTDDRGEFRLFRLEPGDYYIAATPPRNVVRPGAAVAELREIPILTFYPSSLTYTGSPLLSVKAGQELVGIELTMRTIPTVRISGTVTGMTANSAGVPAEIRLYNRRNPISDDEFTSYLPLHGAANLFSPTTGNFGVTGVPAGSYEIVAEVYPRTGTNEPLRLGHSTVEVGNRDIDGLNIALSAGVDVRGKVTSGGVPLDAMKEILVGLQPDGIFAEIDFSGGEPRPLRPDGSFGFSNIAAADYKVRVFGLPANAYVADIRQAGASVYVSGIQTTDKAAEPIEVTLASDGGSIEGVVRTSDQKPSPSTTVVLVPSSESEKKNSERYKIVNSDGQGRFRISGIAPGQYKAFAWQTLPLGAYQNAAFVSKFETQGTAVDVKPSSTTSIRVVRIEN